MRTASGMNICGLLLFAALGIGCIGGTGIPTLTEPADGDTLSDESATLSWSAVESATHYKLEISRDESFSSLAVDEDSLASTSYLLNLETFTSPLEGLETYYWHVAAFSEGWGSFSETRSFYNNNQKRP